MEVILYTSDNKELMVILQAEMRRDYPPLVIWNSSQKGNTIPRYFVKFPEAENRRGHYKEVSADYVERIQGIIESTPA